jgi:hypothetical protein
VLLQSFHAYCPASKAVPSAKEFLIKELFHRRNKIVHFGEINFQRADAEMCLKLATTLSQSLRAMDAECCRDLDAKHSAH